MDEWKQKLLAYIRDHLAQDPSQVTSSDQPLISTGVMDSFALVELSVFIEEEFGVSVPDPEMTAEHFDTIDLGVATIARFAEDS